MYLFPQNDKRELFSLIGGLMPFGLGLVAQHYGLQNTMWLLFAAPVTLLIGVKLSKNLP